MTKTITVEQAIANVIRYRESFAAFGEEVLGIEFEPYQKEALDALNEHDRVAWRSGHGVGKSCVAASAALCFLFTRPLSKVITTATVWRQVKDVLWAEIHKWMRKARLELLGWQWPYDLLDFRLNVSQDWFALGAASDRAENMEGFHAPYLLYIIDEAKAVPDQTWDAIEGALTEAEGEAKILAISTPPLGRTGRFWEIHSRKVKGWKCFHTLCSASKRVSGQWIEERRQEWGEDSPLFQARVKGEFPEVSEDSLIQPVWVDAAVERELQPCGAVELGVDVARFGDDKTALAARQGPKLLWISTYAKQDTMETSGRVAAAIGETGARLVKVDVIGLGAGVVDRLNELVSQGVIDCQVVGVNVASKSEETDSDGRLLYYNLRAEMWGRLAKMLEQGEIDLLDDEDVIGDLLAPKYGYHSDGRIRLEEKEKMKKRLGHSPDVGDAVVMAFVTPSPSCGAEVWPEQLFATVPRK